ncbi:MAG: hypothetical protein EOO75_00135 [Myxococcales bacterium]|nr:MAG: hypothetical protein EOO75_00135 [Myxococcales bacterium]
MVGMRRRLWLLGPLWAAASLAVLAPEAQAKKAACPDGMTLVEGRYCIDTYEAAVVEVTGKGKSRPHPYYLSVKDLRVKAVSKKGVYPQGYISRTEAAAACANAGKRLCRAEEWLRACEGSEGRRYPYGSTLRKGACNSAKAHVMQALFGADMSIYTFDLHYNSPKLNQQRGFLARAGEHADCATPEGVMDLVGNLHEWVADDVNHRFRKLLAARKMDLDVIESATDGNGAFLGGYYSSREQHGTGCGYITPAHEPAYHDYSTGFRCCR